MDGQWAVKSQDGLLARQHAGRALLLDDHANEFEAIAGVTKGVGHS